MNLKVSVEEDMRGFGVGKGRENRLLLRIMLV